MARPRDFNDILAKLPDAKKSGDEWIASCPCPGHKTPVKHLSVKDAGGKALVYCHPNGKHTETEIRQALGFDSLTYSQNGREGKVTPPVIEAVYKYVSAEGVPWEVVRTKPKGFHQRRPDGKGGYIRNIRGLTPTLYHQDDIVKAIAKGDPVYVVEGEKDCNNLWEIGVVATTNPMGAGKWRDSYSDTLRGADIVIIPDNDEPGYQHALKVASSCHGKAKRIRLLELPGNSKDISHWLEAGHTREEFNNLILQAKDYDPSIAAKMKQDIRGTTWMVPVVPDLPEIAWQGLFKDYRELVAETTEATDAFHYATFCQVLGLTLGRRIYVWHATRLYPNFYICLVGRSGLTRKDTCWTRASDILGRLNDTSLGSEESPPFRIVRGIRSYEGLLDELNGERKVRLILLSELLSLLSKAKQESLGNIVPQLTELYDCPNVVNPPVHQKKIIAREPFVSIMAGTTQAWLQKALSERDIYGGFANRWLYFWGLPKDPKPNPPKVDDRKRNELLKEINQVRLWAESVEDGEITISEGADNLFSEYYRDYYWKCQQEGLVPTLIVRIQDFIWKLALLYAAMNLSQTIKPEDLRPAIAVGNYLEMSVAEVFRNFSETIGKQSESRVLEHLKSEGKPVDYRDVYRALNMSAKELNLCVESLTKLGLIKNTFRRGKVGKSIRMLEAI